MPSYYFEGLGKLLYIIYELVNQGIFEHKVQGKRFRSYFNGSTCPLSRSPKRAPLSLLAKPRRPEGLSPAVDPSQAPGNPGKGDPQLQTVAANAHRLEGLIEDGPQDQQVRGDLHTDVRTGCNECSRSQE